MIWKIIINIYFAYRPLEDGSKWRICQFFEDLDISEKMWEIIDSLTAHEIDLDPFEVSTSFKNLVFC